MMDIEEFEFDEDRELHVDTVDGRDWTFQPGWSIDQMSDGFKGVVDMGYGLRIVAITARHVTAVSQDLAGEGELTGKKVEAPNRPGAMHTDPATPIRQAPADEELTETETQTPRRKSAIRHVSHDEVMSMVSLGCGDHRSTVAETYRAWQDDELHNPHLRDLMLTWGGSINEIDLELEQPPLDEIEGRLRGLYNDELRTETKLCAVLNKRTENGEDPRDTDLWELEESRGRLDRLADLILHHRAKRPVGWASGVTLSDLPQ